MEFFIELQPAEDVVIGGASAQSTAAPAETTHARLATTTDVRYLRGSNPTALSSSTLLPSGAVELISCTPGQKIAGIQDSAAGKLNITFMKAS